MTGRNFWCEDRADRREETQVQQKWREDYKIIESKHRTIKYKGKRESCVLKMT